MDLSDFKWSKRPILVFAEMNYPDDPEARDQVVEHLIGDSAYEAAKSQRVVPVEFLDWMSRPQPATYSRRLPFLVSLCTRLWRTRR